MWYFGRTGWSHFQTDESSTLNCHLIQISNFKFQIDVKFQCSVFIFLNRGFHAFVLTKFPLSLFHTLLCQYLTIAISISSDSFTHCTKNHISHVLEYHGKLKKTKYISSFHQLFDWKKTVFSITVKFKTRTSH